MKYRFSDLADIPKLQELMGSLYWLTDIAIGIIEADGDFLFCAGWRGACTQGEQKLCDCHAFISANLDPISYTCRRCPTGMLHYACPIVIDGEHVASVYIGQFFTDPPDEVAIRLEAANRGLRPEEYRKMLDKVPIIPPMRLTLLLKYLKDLANMLADIGLQRRQQMETLEILQLSQERLQYLSCHDPLTGLRNRVHFEEQMAAMEQSPHLPCAVMVLDLDGLKQVNDLLGHHAGDLMLQAAATIIREAAPTESTVSRIGGDEFALLLPNSDLAVIDAIRQRILDKVAHYNNGRPQQPLGISIGFAIADSLPMSMRALVKEADARMYQDKNSRKDKDGKGPADEFCK